MANFFRVLLQHLPNYLLAQVTTTHLIGAIHGPENEAVENTAGRRPSIDRNFDPVRHRRRSDPAMLSTKIDDAPPTVPLLDVHECERRDLGSAETATEENGQYRAIAQPLECRYVWRAEERLRLAKR